MIGTELWAVTNSVPQNQSRNRLLYQLDIVLVQAVDEFNSLLGFPALVCVQTDLHLVTDCLTDRADSCQIGSKGLRRPWS